VFSQDHCQLKKLEKLDNPFPYHFYHFELESMSFVDNEYEIDIYYYYFPLEAAQQFQLLRRLIFKDNVYILKGYSIEGTYFEKRMNSQETRKINKLLNRINGGYYECDCLDFNSMNTYFFVKNKSQILFSFFGINYDFNNLNKAQKKSMNAEIEIFKLMTLAYFPNKYEKSFYKNFFRY
jgi:hypothetical protein